MTQGYCTPVFNAFKQAEQARRVPATCYAYNGELGACAQPGAPARSSGCTVVMQIAMKDALDMLDGKPAPPKNKIIPVPMTLYVHTATPPKVTSRMPGQKVRGSERTA